jgi:hypothetical protein
MRLPRSSSREHPDDNSTSASNERQLLGHLQRNVVALEEESSPTGLVRYGERCVLCM